MVKRLTKEDCTQIISNIKYTNIKITLNLADVYIVKSSLPDRIVMKVRAEAAPKKTVSRECFIAIIAAIKNVLSPISETIITDNAAMNAWTNDCNCVS